MKITNKIIYCILVFMVIIPEIYALDNVKLVGITDKCHIINNNSVEIPIKIYSLSDGTISELITEYKLGEIEKKEDFEYTIKNISNKNIKNIKIDTLKDGNNMSNIYYYVTDQISVKENENIFNITLKINLNNTKNDTIKILNNEVILSNQKTCELINNYKTEVIQNEIIIEKNKYPMYLTFILLFLIVILLICLYIINKKK